MSDEYNKPHERIRMTKTKDAPRERSLRVFRSAPGEWTVQLRAPIGLGFGGYGGDGRDFIIASADCSLDDMRAIRDALDAQIRDAETRTT